MNEILLFFSIMASLFLFIGGTIVGWSAIRKILAVPNFKHIFFGLGLIIITANHFFIEFKNLDFRPTWLYVTFGIGYILITIALSKKVTDYFLIATTAIPLFLPRGDVTYAFVAFPILVLAYYSYKNYCKMFCSEDQCQKKILFSGERIEWTIFFILMAITAALYILQTRGTGGSPVYYHYVTLVLNLVAGGILFYHIFHCEKYKKNEKQILSILTITIFTLATAGFIANININKYLINNLEQIVREEAAVVKYAAEQEFGKTLPDLLLTRDAELSDFCDRIFSESGIRGTFFLGNERIAASLSATGRGRMLGTKINDTELTNAVLIKGEDYVGRVIKGGDLSIGAYSPIYKDGKVIGMYGTGKFLTDIKDFYNKLYLVFVIITSIIVTTILTILYQSSQRKQVKILK